MSADTGKVLPEEEPLKNRENKKNDFESKGFFEKLTYLKSNVTVEPIFAGIVIPSMLARLAIQNLNMDKTCRLKLNFGEEICDALLERKGNLTYYEGEVQKVISSIETWKSVIQTALPTILVIFMGAWSDRTGNRKLCILLPIVGEFLVCISNILSVVFFNDISVEVTMFLEAIFPAITGGWVMVFLGVFSYVGDITDEKTRTFRVGLVNLCLTAGIPIGVSLSGILLKLWGYYGIFATSGLIYLTTFTYGYIYLEKQTKPGIDKSEKAKPVTCKDIVTLIKETVLCAFKKRDGRLRMKVILTLLAVAIIYGPDHGEKIITYMFVRYRLKWDALKFSIYSTYSIVVHSIVPIVEILNATTFTSLRSMASKLVETEEMGRMNSLFSLVETLAALVFDPSYTTLYSMTISDFAGSVYIFSACLTIPAIIILVWLFTQYRIETKVRRKQETTQLKL
ncbi:proton-coupled folate transporter-like isoform X2 [Danaus plexippus]|uniref:proton-coupled folate transporter-like isoform X2 n=1 Tax=Danaus plexippus TaxID=13037 RepID=UPI002AAF9051|nr:proton-coupled folate transporter-like isoform X2 [Danaus plexippus]